MLDPEGDRYTQHIDLQKKETAYVFFYSDALSTKSTPLFSPLLQGSGRRWTRNNAVTWVSSDSEGFFHIT